MKADDLGGLDITTLANTELQHLVVIPEPWPDGLRYYLTKAAKLEMLSGATPEVVTGHLEAARAKQSEHHANLSRRRREGPMDKGAQIEARLGDETWTYVEHRKTDGFRDAATGRRASVAYVLSGMRSGRTVQVTRGTVEHAHAHVRPIGNWPPRPGRKSLVGREAAKAGVVTMASLRKH